ncbi:uncharacterized protein UTRI_10459 [Ustilago trichophora]|uniref:Transcription factor domain-containing protein n=1 Tax=Ustilago trichophora TaxID=86804 RepID=A0A5C3E9R5_9BASI|nr:uncharacterized protein UTRI_10459 [Ustilago trichophora]
MTSCDQSMARKRTLADSCSSSQTTSKHRRIAPTCSSTSFTDPHHPAPSIDDAASTAYSGGHRDSFGSQSSSSSDFSTTSSSIRRATSDPFPRYALGIPHLDVLLPSRDGLDLLHAYHQGIGWIHNPVDRTTLLETLEEAQRHGADSIHPHRLACLLAALALGDLFSSCFPSCASNSAQPIDSPSKRGRIWFGVASACLAGSRTEPELMHNPTPDACSALYLMSTYLLCSNDEELFHRSQGLTGLALILAKSALVPSCLPLARPQSPSQTAAPSFPTAESPSRASSPASPSQAATSLGHNNKKNNNNDTEQDRLHCNRLLSDLIFHLRCQVLTFALPCPSSQSASSQNSPSLTSFPDVPTIEAIWTAFGTPLYASLDAFGNRYSPNIFHNWKLGLADLMHQVSCLTNQSMSLEQLSSASPMPCEISAQTAGESASSQRAQRQSIMLPDHGQIVKLDERIRRYHASLPDFLLLHRPLPIEMAGKVDEDELGQIICQRHMACSMVHRMLMALHRPWFLSALACRSRSSKTKPAQEKQDRTPLAAEASASLDASLAASATISELNESEEKKAEPENGMQPSPPAMFSLSAVLRSATWQTETFASAAACAPPQALAWWQFTNNALAAAIVQATALLRLSCPSARPSSTGSNEPPQAERPTPATHFHNQVRNDLDKNICSFQNVAKRCKLAAKALPFLQRVSTAIDLGICKSQSTATFNKDDALQSSLSPQNTCHVDSSTTAFTDTAAQTRNQSRLEPFTCNNSNSINIISHSNTSSNNNGNSNVPCIPVTGHSNSNSIKQQPIPPSQHSSTGARHHHRHSETPNQPRRASSAKSELEAIFGPLASGLELSTPSESYGSAKPLYRQNLDPLPMPPVIARDRDEHSSQPTYSEDGGSSSTSSGILPCTPRSRSPQLDVSQQPTDFKGAVAEEGRGGNAAEGATGKQKQNQASDLVLQCIRFWQPDMLVTPSSRN